MDLDFDELLPGDDPPKKAKMGTKARKKGSDREAAGDQDDGSDQDDSGSSADEEEAFCGGATG